MSRILRRPMFRKGGYTGEGVMSLVEPKVEPRKNYFNGSDYIQTPEEILMTSVPEKTFEMPSIGSISARDIAKIFTGGNQQKLTGFEKSPEARPSIREELKAEIPEIEKPLVTPEIKPNTQITSESDLETVYKDLLPLFEKELGMDADETRRQKYLQLAKFGLGVLAQPGGSLVRAIGKAGQEPLAGLERISELERRERQAPKRIALEAALRETAPGSFQQGVKDLMKLGLSKEQAIKTVTEKGEATRTATYEGVVENLQKNLSEQGIVTNAAAARGTAIDLLNAEKLGIPSYSFEKFPKDKPPVEGNYYVMENGQSGRYYKGSLIKPGEKGFTGELPK